MSDCPITTGVIVQDLSVTTQSVTIDDSGIFATVVIEGAQIAAAEATVDLEVVNVTAVVEDLSFNQTVVPEVDPILSTVVVEETPIQTASIARNQDPILAHVIISGGEGPEGPPGPGLWVHLGNSWTTPPVLNATPPVLGGEVYDYVYGPTTYYRHIPDPYDSTADSFYASYSAGVLSGLVATRGEPIT